MDTGAAAIKVFAIQRDSGNRLDQFEGQEAYLCHREPDTKGSATSAERARYFVYFENLEWDAQACDVRIHRGF